MNYCQSCGSSLSFLIPDNDSLYRHVCTSCKVVYYKNPVVVAGSLPFWKGNILLCRRAIEPGYGCWTLPGGYVESGETIEQCAQRETWEEARARVKLSSIISVTNVTAANQVHIFFQAEMLSEQFEAGTESLEVRLFHPKDIPWDEIAFYSVEETLRKTLDKSKKIRQNRLPLSLTCLRPPRKSLRYSSTF
jgi:ADP-ribose pyrophosphatase YjhB (NUDIX family)